MNETSGNAQTQQLVKMANQIGTFFHAQFASEPEAAKAVASHLKMFWAPTMRAALVGALDHGEADELDPLVVASLRAHRAVLLNEKVHLPAESRETSPQGGGDAG